MSKHTPGPWRYWTQSRAGRGEDTCTFVSADNTEVLRAVTKTITEADARLIAAAPDLLEALQSAERAMSNRDFALMTLCGDRSVRMMIRDAIAKVEGKT
jgi:hypothetical protein